MLLFISVIGVLIVLLLGERCESALNNFLVESIDKRDSFELSLLVILAGSEMRTRAPKQHSQTHSHRFEISGRWYRVKGKFYNQNKEDIPNVGA